MTRLVWLDCETTGLDPRVHEPWEVAAIIGDVEHVWMWRPGPATMFRADPQALDIGQFHERAPSVADGSERQAAHDIARTLAGHIVVGSNPSFDVAMLTSWLRRWRLELDVHYRPVCVITMAAGWLAGQRAAAAELGPTIGEIQLLGSRCWSIAEDAPYAEPWRSYELSQALGIDPPGDDGHQALADARWAKRLYQRIVGDDT